MTAVSPRSNEPTDIVYPATLPFALVHLSCIGVIWSGVTWRAALLGVALYWLRIFAIGAGYHRYFSHRAFETSRVFQFVLAWLAQSSAQNSVLWWSARHRDHHLYSDTEQDTHSPGRNGFLYSHVGWIFDQRHRETDLTRVADLARYPELRFLARFEHLPAVSLALLCFLVAGWPGLVVGFVWSTVAVYHATFCINSLAHTHGRQRYVTGDHSRNNWGLALMTMGEGWHNNHHAYQSSARQGFRWWEIDLTFYGLWLLSKLGVVWNLKAPPESVLRNEHRLGSRVVRRAAEQLAARFDPDRIASAIAARVHGPAPADAAGLREPTQAVLPHAPEMPSREDLLASARTMFARTPSLDEIVDGASRLLSAAVGERLSGRAIPAAA